MLNSKNKNTEDLPSSKQLIKSTLIAALVSLLLLVLVVLPAEYGIDPTGVGEVIGLKKMGDLKVSLEKEVQSDLKSDSSKVKEEANKPKEEHSPSILKKVMSHTLEPGEAIEIKVVMQKGASVKYKWQASNGRLNHDTHGDSKTNEFISYKKGRSVDSDEGMLTAAFDGSHGWFWRNRDKKNVEVLLEVEGEFTKIMKL